ncbi:bifunctional cobalt-precorrin-7 (C(5))-methyltransferase/cobalt-precorrin-6B (C(15))-methyltransferase [Rhodobacter ferrooxidans]|uniref:Precorrin-6Y C5,15-methyltransferase (Decarboxylating), CbiT subunit n=1 Tax=Rhodobacter ferrooxidans TaxID=371731 RepID=C8S2S5_9RHOB|nr:bifunctional cobalt-precorrin-7 (C(5))-methyltransferase/cobalt-precorrin-6B (C(15))-methyltransferase [Rhodobacter sp. SW2]EEW24751.1 precorrin-6Y C5,15-methyltransferase (decarboxylating), CbiT subunit [Rhodobacter sp. SW2]
MGKSVSPWLTLIGIGEDGLAGLSDASRDALARAEVVFGGPRHLGLAQVGDRGQAWPVPFSVDPVLALRGRAVVVLASGDPFWHGAGGSLVAHLAAGEWLSHPAPSVFALAANRLGWKLEETRCIGLHAAPFARLVPELVNGAGVICTLRDGAAAGELAAWLCGAGFGGSTLWVLEALGGPDERVRQTRADSYDLTDVRAPVALAIRPSGTGLPRTPGLADDSFAHDGQITKAPVRALTLASLAPRPGELLWDLGAGSGSISVEWCLAGGKAVAVEQRADRCANIAANALRFGVEHRLVLVQAASQDALPGLPAPDAVFIGGGADAALLAAVWDQLAPGARLVVNGVTLETEALLAAWHAEKGGDLLRIELSRAAPLGRMRGWVAARPVVQWSVTR